MVLIQHQPLEIRKRKKAMEFKDKRSQNYNHAIKHNGELDHLASSMLGDGGLGGCGGVAGGVGVHPHSILYGVSGVFSHVLHLLSSLLNESSGLFLGLPCRLSCPIRQIVLLDLQQTKPTPCIN